MDTLPDPLGDRVVHEVVPPPHHPLTHSLMFTSSSKPNWRVIKDHLAAEGRISKVDLLLLVEQVTSTFRRERNLLELRDPVTVVGDIHGQFYDFIKMLDIGGNPETTKYLFLGDFVDRGNFSIEVIASLFAIKINFPTTIFMIRGNHECRQMTTFFNFRAECLAKYDLEVYERIMECFDTMPISCLVNNKFLAVHGGISPELDTLSAINSLNRITEPPRSGLYCDILWSDPVDTDNGKTNERYRPNETRGCSYFFNVDAVNAFLKRNKLLSIIRAHEAQLDGYKLHKWNGAAEFPTVITVFSAPNYCDVYNNKGAIIKFENNTLNIQQYNYTAHPYLLPDFMDIFTWSIPFVNEKVLDILMRILTKPAADDEEPAKPIIEEQKRTEPTLQRSDPDAAQRKAAKREILRNRIKFVGKMSRMMKTLREERETVVKLKGLAPDNKIPMGILTQGSEAMESVINMFEQAKAADSVNEKMPELS